MAKYVVVFADLLTGVVKGQLPVESFDYSLVLSAPGAASFRLPLYTGRTITYAVGDEALSADVAPLKLTDLLPWQTAIYVERDNVVVWSGIVVGNPKLDVGKNEATVSAQGFHAYFRRRILRQNLSVKNTDQATLARALINAAQDTSRYPNGDIGIDTSDTTLTGVQVERSYKSYERNNIGELIEQLGATENGFDFQYVSERNGAHYTTKFQILYPRSGRQTNIVLRLGANVYLLDATVNGADIATRVEVTGDGDNEAKTFGIATASDFAGYPLLDLQLQYSGVSKYATLDAYARQRLKENSGPVIIPTIALLPTGDPEFGTYRVGDSVKVEGSHGLLEINDAYRITELKVAVDTSGSEEISLSLAPGDRY